LETHSDRIEEKQKCLTYNPYIFDWLWERTMPAKG